MSKMMRGALLPAIVAVVSLIAIMLGGPANVKLDADPGTVKLEANPGSDLPVPKHVSSSLVNHVGRSKAAFRKELDASVPANLASVLAFYRSELGKLAWKESSEGAVVKSDSVQLAFTTPDGSAALKLGRNKGQTTVNLAQKIPAVAAAANVLPNPGQARLLLSNDGGAEATLTINGRTIKLVPGEGGLQVPGPGLELPPGKYQYSLEVSGVTRNNTIELTADDTWKLWISPEGEAMPQHTY